MMVQESMSPVDTKAEATIVVPGVDTEGKTNTAVPLRKRILSVVWDSLDKAPEERKFVAKIDWWILTYCCIAYFVKYLDQTNVSY